MLRSVFFGLLAVLALAVPATAGTGWQWTEAAAEDSLVEEYRTVDPWALKEAQDKETLGVANTREIQIAKRAARPEWAHCQGVGAHQKAYYGRFWCRVHVWSYLTDYEATKKLTLVPTGRYTFRVVNGYH